MNGTFLSIEQKMTVQKAIQSALGYSPSLDAIEIRSGYTRFDTEKRGHRNGFFKVTTFHGALVVHFGDWSVNGSSHVWREGGRSGRRPLTEEEQKAIYEGLQRQRQEEERIRREAIETMRDRFAELPLLDSVGESFPYLQKKGISKSYIAKFDRDNNCIVFPFYDTNGHLTGLQEIDALGNKKIVRYSRKKDSFSLLRFKNADYSRVYACEGYATGLSIFEATGAPVIICIDAGNLEGGISSALDYLSISAENVVIVADNDTNGKGEEEARKACNSLGCAYILISYEGMDANDYANEYGKEFLHLLLTEGVDAWRTEFGDDLNYSIDYGENDEGEENEEE